MARTRTRASSCQVCSTPLPPGTGTCPVCRQRLADQVRRARAWTVSPVRTPGWVSLAVAPDQSSTLGADRARAAAALRRLQPGCQVLTAVTFGAAALVWAATPTVPDPPPWNAPDGREAVLRQGWPA